MPAKCMMVTDVVLAGDEATVRTVWGPGTLPGLRHRHRVGGRGGSRASERISQWGVQNGSRLDWWLEGASS